MNKGLFRISILCCTFFITSVFSGGSKIKLKEAMYYKKLENNKVQCTLCFRRCEISNGERGGCRVRENKNGVLYSLVYGRPVGLQIDPIELEPM